LADMLGDDFGLGGAGAGARRRQRGARGAMGGAAGAADAGAFGPGRFGGGPAMGGRFGAGGRGGPGGPSDGGPVDPNLAAGGVPREGDGPWHQFESDEKRIALTLFQPQGLFRFIASVLRPFRLVFMLMPLLAGIGVATVVSNFDDFAVDVARERGGIPLILRLIFSFLTVNLVTEISRGIIGAGLGGDAYKFGIRLFLGLVPRFYTAVRGISWFTRRDIIWLYGGPILVRMVLFGLGVITWWGTRGDGTLISTGAILLSVVSVISLVFSSNPLARNNDGYHVLAAILQIPDLRKRANRALMAKFRGRKVPGEETDPDSERALRAYALGSMLFVLTVVGILLFMAAQWLEAEHQGTGVAIFLALMLYIILHLRAQIRAQKVRVEEWKAEQRAERVRSALAQRRSGGAMAALPGPMMGAGAGGGGGGLAVAGAGGAGGAAAGGGGGEAIEKPKSNPLVGWILLAILGVIAVLPWDIKPGGPVRIMPSQQREVHTEIAGILEEVYVSGGQYVEAGEVIARITNAEEARKVSGTNADIAEQQAILEELNSRPRPEDVRLARQELETARVQLQFSTEEVTRLKGLSDEGFVSKDEYQEAVKKRDVDRAQVAEEEANLSRVSTPAHPKEIEAAQARLAGLREELSYFEGQLERTVLRMPFDGKVVTLNLEDKEGKFLDKGEFFATVENAESVRVQFSIPQSDVSEIEVGGETLVKFYSYPGQKFTGEIIDISTAVEEEEGGEVLIVTTVIPNEEGLLKTGMTGFGKVKGEQKTVIEAFTRAIVRFVL
ncbi:MAG: efflux RND transporter periplasmic adaptor subunit, partial [Pseudomonadota bacterium]